MAEEGPLAPPSAALANHRESSLHQGLSWETCFLTLLTFYTLTYFLSISPSLQSFGFNLMATSNYHWLLSFSRAEQALLVAVDEDGGCRRKCYRVVRQLKEDTWCPGTKPVITAFHLQVPNHNAMSLPNDCPLIIHPQLTNQLSPFQMFKVILYISGVHSHLSLRLSFSLSLQTLLFWCCEKFPCGRDWRCVKECVLRVARKLLKCVSQRYLRHYFVRSYNLLKYSNTTELDHTAQKINDFIANPSLYVH